MTKPQARRNWECVVFFRQKWRNKPKFLANIKGYYLNVRPLFRLLIELLEVRQFIPAEPATLPSDQQPIVGLLRELRNLDTVRLQQAPGGVIKRRDGDLIRDLGLQ